MKIQLDQICLIAAISKEVDKQAKAQGLKAEAIPYQFNSIVDAANTVVAAFGREPKMASDDMGVANWLASDDTGISSKTMAAVLCGVSYPQRDWCHPRDNADLGRCVRFLKAVPEARGRLSLMSTVSEVWKGLVENWDELEGMYLMKPHSQELYKLLKGLGC